MQKITTFLWFNDQAEEAINFYVSLFKNSKILSLSRNGDGGAGEFPGLSGVSRQNRSRLPGMRHAVGHIVPPPVLDGLPVPCRQAVLRQIPGDFHLFRDADPQGIVFT